MPSPKRAGPTYPNKGNESCKIMQKVEDANKKSDIPKLQIGDTIDVHQQIGEQKERIQIFNGVVMSAKAGACANR